MVLVNGQLLNIFATLLAKDYYTVASASNTRGINDNLFADSIAGPATAFKSSKLTIADAVHMLAVAISRRRVLDLDWFTLPVNLESTSSFAPGNFSSTLMNPTAFDKVLEAFSVCNPLSGAIASQGTKILPLYNAENAYVPVEVSDDPFQTTDFITALQRGSYKMVFGNVACNDFDFTLLPNSHFTTLINQQSLDMFGGPFFQSFNFHGCWAEVNATAAPIIGVVDSQNDRDVGTYTAYPLPNGCLATHGEKIDALLPVYLDSIAIDTTQVPPVPENDAGFEYGSLRLEACLGIECTKLQLYGGSYLHAIPSYRYYPHLWNMIPSSGGQDCTDFRNLYHMVLTSDIFPNHVATNAESYVGVRDMNNVGLWQAEAGQQGITASRAIKARALCEAANGLRTLAWLSNMTHT
jgi:hypothetical protein